MTRSIFGGAALLALVLIAAWRWAEAPRTLPEPASAAAQAAPGATPFPGEASTLSRGHPGAAGDPLAAAPRGGAPAMESAMDSATAAVDATHASGGATSRRADAPPATPAAHAGVAADPPPSFVLALPQGWFRTKGSADSLLVTRDPTVAYSGHASLMLVGFADGQGGASIQQIRADAYRGQTVMLSAQVRTRDIGSGGLWLRADRVDGQTQFLDNMRNRPIQGTSDWTRYDIVMRVSDNAGVLSFGAGIGGGTGAMWVDDVQLRVVPEGTPVTAVPASGSWMPAPPNIPAQPINTGFENSP